MRVVFLVICSIFSLMSPTHAAEAMVGNFLVKLEKDPFGDADTYVAITAKGGSLFAIRCLEGELTVAFSISSKADEGDPVAVKLRIDNDPVEDSVGSVISVLSSGILVQAGDKNFIRRLVRAKSVAFRGTVNGISATTSFELKASDRVVAGALRACKA